MSDKTSIYRYFYIMSDKFILYICLIFNSAKSKRIRGLQQNFWYSWFEPLQIINIKGIVHCSGSEFEIIFKPHDNRSRSKWNNNEWFTNYWTTLYCALRYRSGERHWWNNCIIDYTIDRDSISREYADFRQFSSAINWMFTCRGTAQY